MRISQHFSSSQGHTIVILLHMLSLLFLIYLSLSTSQSLFFVNSTFNPVKKPIISVCGGNYHGCALFKDNRMKCWGLQQSTGAVSNYGSTSSSVADFIPYFDPGTNQRITKISCPGYGVCVLLESGNIKCVGNNNMGEAGIGSSTPTIVGAISGYAGDTLPAVKLGANITVMGLSGGNYHNCVVTTAGKVKCFGWNLRGQLGLGDTTDRGTSASHLGDKLPFVDFGTNVTVSSVFSTTSGDHNCVILSAPSNVAQRVKCWGRNDYYQLGSGDMKDRGDEKYEMGDNLTLVDFGDESRVKQIALGRYHTCALLLNEVFKCFGTNDLSQIGTGSTAIVTQTGNAMLSIPIDSGKKIQLLSTGTWHTCIVYDDMLTMKCVGLNDKGQLGQGDHFERGDTPTTIYPKIPAINLGTGSLNISSIHSGEFFVCVIFIDNGVKCFGDNQFGQLVIGSTLVTVGDQANQMGSNLQYAELLSPTQAPTKAPTNTPSKTPTFTPSFPTQAPTKAPTKLPTRSPTKLPTRAPTIKPSSAPTTHPTLSPTEKCDYQSAKLCKYDIKCMWKKVNGKKICTLFDCITLNKGKCGKERSRCRWNKKTSLCDVKMK